VRPSAFGFCTDRGGSYNAFFNFTGEMPALADPAFVCKDEGTISILPPPEPSFLGSPMIEYLELSKSFYGSFHTVLRL